MIGIALHNLLSTNPALLGLVGNRVSAVAFREGETVSYPALTYNTQGVAKLACRAGGNTKIGLLEIGILAANTLDLETLSDTLSDVLDGYTGTHAGYLVSTDANTAEFDEKVDEISAYYKALRFDFSATKL